MSDSFSAGSATKSDCLVTWRPGGATLEIKVESSSGGLFRKAIEAAARTEASRFVSPRQPAGTMPRGRLEITDEGALDYVIEARVEAVLRASGFSRSSGSTQLDVSRIASSPRSRPRRTRLYVPGNQPDLQVNAGLFGADCLLFDLEDSVESARKDEARLLVRRLLVDARKLLGAAELVVRVNPLGSGWGRADLEGIIQAAPQALVLPKCECAAQVEAWEAEVSRLESDCGLEPGFVRFMPLVETARGLANAVGIAAASGRNVALCFGAEDFRAELGLPRSATEEELAVARSLVVIAARAAGIEAQDTVYSAVDDEEGLMASARRARAAGFSGKGIVHPGQVAAVHEAFAPGTEEVAWARAAVAAMEAAEREGRGATSLDGLMLDAPVLERARRILAQAGR